MSIHNDAIMILRVLEENGAVGGNDMINAEIMEIAGLSEEAHDNAETYLLEGGYIEGASGGPYAKRWLSSLGVNYLEQVMSQRLPLSIDSERILNYITRSVSKPSETLTRAKITTALHLNDSRYDSAVKLLLDFNLAEKGGNVAVVRVGDGITHRSEESLRATREGRQAVHREFRDPQSASSTSQVFNIHAPSNIQAASNSINSQIEQQITQTLTENDPEVLRDAISELLKGLLEVVSNDLTLDERATYTEAAAEVQKELSKPNPEVNVLQQWMARLAFLDKAFSVGEKALSLSSKALPTVLMLIKIAEVLTSR